MKVIPLIIERTGTQFVGRAQFDDDLIVADEKTIEKLELTIKKVLKDFHAVDTNDIKFKHSYDLSSLFEKFSYLKISSIAEIASVNASLLRQYVIGNKQASPQQAKKIEQAIHKVGKELQNTQVYVPTTPK